MDSSKKGIIFTGAYYLELGRKQGGATRVANYCRQFGWDIEVVDYFPFWSNEQLEDFLKKTVTNDTKFFGFSYTWLHHFIELADKIKMIKEWYPDIKIIIGGQVPYLESLHADYYILGYGEVALGVVLEYAFGNGKVPLHKLHIDGGMIIDAIKLYTSHNLKEYTVEYDERDFITSDDLLTIELSRGCKFACSFCNYPYIGIREDTSRTEESLYNELLQNYKKWGVTKYIIADDTMNDRHEKLIKLRNAVKRLPFEPDFTGYIRLDLIAAHPEQLDILSDCRMWGHFYGIETLNQDAGRIIKKGMDPNRIKDTLLKTREHFLNKIDRYRGTVAMIAGLPKEPVESMNDSNEWLRKNWGDQCVVWHPLQIIKDANGIQAFGANLEKYGFKELSNEFLSEEKYNHYIYNNLISKRKDNTVWWESEYTNYFDMLDLVTEYRKDIYGISNFGILQYMITHGSKEAFDVKIPPYEAFAYEPHNTKSKQHIDKYIAKKLNR